VKSNQQTPKWKIAAIPILLVILGTVLWNNSRSNSDQESLELLTRTKQKNTATASPWNTGQKQTALRYNPFKIQNAKLIPNTSPTSLASVTANSDPTPPAHSDQSSSYPTQSIQDLSSKSVTLLIRKGKKDIAIIGGQVIRSGQRLETGLEVQSIDMNRILLSNPNDTPKPSLSP
jgi:hypothetical protein